MELCLVVVVYIGSLKYSCLNPTIDCT
ncbi:hypothetical protein Zm00014a_023960 [Zea mays]|uniref:Uncharacterized protein n=1 Tax=Zea mays TaxID=4577 RepID=A0A3L6EQX7_MAIZE|nr:hypothetical protein Zm00014a_023960 [Zea mays]